MRREEYRPDRNRDRRNDYTRQNPFRPEMPHQTHTPDQKNNGNAPKSKAENPVKNITYVRAEDAQQVAGRLACLVKKGGIIGGIGRKTCGQNQRQYQKAKAQRFGTAGAQQRFNLGFFAFLPARFGALFGATQ